ncbi:MAG: hypothetical protein ACI4A5_06270 [Hominilimicola sp.]
MNIADFTRKNMSGNGIANQNNSGNADNPIMDGVNIGELQKQFNAFKRQFGNKNPQDVLNQLINSGMMSQGQFQKLKQMSAFLQNFLK